MSDPVAMVIAALAAPTAANIGVLVTGLLLGIRHGIDWDHIAAITDITSTTAAAGTAEAAHAEQHREITGQHHGHGGQLEMRAHDAGPGAATLAPATTGGGVAGSWRLSEQGEAIRLGTLYALGHGFVVIVLGIAAIAFGALLPDWLDPLMGRVVGVTLVVLGLWVLYSVYRYAWAGETFRLRSRWMLLFDGVRMGWRRLQSRLHGHEHVEPLEMSSYGTRTALGVGMIHGVGAETGSQALLIAAVGGASSAGLGVPMLFAFVVGLLISNFAIVLFSSVGFVTSQTRERVYVGIGAVAGVFSLAIGLVFVFGQDAILPDLGSCCRSRSESALSLSDFACPEKSLPSACSFRNRIPKSDAPSNGGCSGAPSDFGTGSEQAEPAQSPPRTSNRARRSEPSTSEPTITTAMITTDSGSSSGVSPKGARSARPRSPVLPGGSTGSGSPRGDRTASPPRSGCMRAR